MTINLPINLATDLSSKRCQTLPLHPLAGYYGGGGTGPRCTGGGGSSGSRNVTVVLNSKGQAAPGHGSVTVTIAAWRDSNVTRGHAVERLYSLLEGFKTPSVLWGGAAASALMTSITKALTAGIGSAFGATPRVCAPGTFVDSFGCAQCAAGNFSTQADSSSCRATSAPEAPTRSPAAPPARAVPPTPTPHQAVPSVVPARLAPSLPRFQAALRPARRACSAARAPAVRCVPQGLSRE